MYSFGDDDFDVFLHLLVVYNLHILEYDLRNLLVQNSRQN